MDYTCKNCGNVFGDHLTVCPACGAPVDTVSDQTTAAEAAPNYQPQPEVQQQPYQQQGFPQQPYQQQAYQQPYQQQGYNPNAAYQAGAPVYNPNMMAQPKSKLVAGLLGIFLGGIGVHNFYLGFSGKAVIQIIVTLVTCGIGSIWGLIEGILILTGSINTDADGRLLGE